MLGLDRTKAFGNKSERIIPAHGFEFARLAIFHERRGNAIGRIHEVKASAAALHAQKPRIRGAVHGLRIDDFVTLHNKIELAANAAMRARSAHARDFPFTIITAALFRERARGARLGAVSTALALGCFPIGAERRLDGGANTALAGAQRMIARRRVACADASLARDAQVRIEREERIAVEHGGVFCGRLEGELFHAELATEILQLACAVLLAAEAEVRRVQAVARQNEVERKTTRGIERIGGRRDLHAFLRKRRARGHQALHAFDFDHAHAARGDVAHVLQEAQRGDVDVRRAGRVQNG